jgi:hypothetical protein
MPKDISIRYGIIAGEVISQIRSALDHTVCKQNRELPAGTASDDVT